MNPEERKRLRERMMSGILGFGRNVYQGNPLVKKGVDLASGFGLGGYPFSYANNLPTIEITEGQPRFRPQPGRGGSPSGLYGVPQRVRGLGTGSEVYKPAGPRGGQLTGPMAENPLVPARQTPMKEEEDEFGFLDAMFLANLVAGMQGGPPPTPYGFAVGGGNRSFVSLPTMGRTV